MTDYIINQSQNIIVNGEHILTPDDILNAIKQTNESLLALNEQTMKLDINIFEVLGLRNLSGLVGEYFAKCIALGSNNKLQGNPHQDGYPDLLLTNTVERNDYFSSICCMDKAGKNRPKTKEDFSPYKFGGIEVKATCGSVKTKEYKPIVGEQRIKMLDGFDWKAHHRSTNNLLAILWDFINGCPTIVACFYQNDLNEEDWGKIVQPKTDGGRTTSVSVIRSSGIKKLCKNWIAVIDSDEYIETLAKKKWIGHRVDKS